MKCSSNLYTTGFKFVNRRMGNVHVWYTRLSSSRVRREGREEGGNVSPFELRGKSWKA